LAAEIVRQLAVQVLRQHCENVFTFGGIHTNACASRKYLSRLRRTASRAR
jgi:hypothetical protein